VTSLLIPARFNGPRGSGNGGVSAGKLASLLPADATVQVTLRVPPPLDVPLQIEQDGEHRTCLLAYSDEVLVAEAAVVWDEIEPVPPVAFDDAVEAATRFDGFTEHPYSTCFVCGTERPDQDGLALYAGAIEPSDRTRVATPFVPRDDVQLDATLVWAALDCPGGWSIDLIGRRALLGRLTARVFSAPEVGERCVVVAAGQGWDGRKAFSRSTAYGEDGRELGRSRATWIERR
jgi:hypothetical protein